MRNAILGNNLNSSVDVLAVKVYFFSSMPIVTVILLDSELKGYVNYNLYPTISQNSLGAA